MQNKTLRVVSTVALLAGLATTAVVGQVPGLKNQDVGIPTLTGSTTFAGGKYTIVGGGNDIWNTSDNFHYAYISVTGDFDYVVKVEDLQGPDAWTKAELMSREVDEASFGGPDGGDRHVSTMTTRSAGQNEVALQWRSDARNSGSAWANDIGIGTPIQRPTYPNTWLRLERVGSKFWSYASADGTSWTVLRGSPYDFESLNGNETAPRTEGNMANTLAIGMAVTAHNDADETGGIGVFSGFAAWTPIPIAITTQPPATLAVAANSTLTITAAATGDPVHYQWYKGTDAIPGAMSATYTKTLAQTGDSGTYSVRCFGAGQTTATSSTTQVTVTTDSTPPTLVKAIGSGDFTHATITFSEPVTAPTATTASNYVIPGLSVTDAALSADGFTVTLTTGTQAQNTSYTISVSNLLDGGNNAIAAGSTIAFKSFSILTGKVTQQRWNRGNDGTSLDDFAETIVGTGITPIVPPDNTDYIDGMDTAWNLGENYTGRIWSWFTPAETGDYVFLVSADDNCNVYLSTDEDPAKKVIICNEPQWNNQRDWNGTNRRPSGENRSDTFSGTLWPNGNTIQLTANKRYWIEAHWREGGGGDGAGVTFAFNTDVAPANGTVSVLSGGVVATIADTSTLPPSITSPTAIEPLTLEAGGTTKLSVIANNPAADTLNYQWQRDGVNIAGATGTEYTIANASVNDIGQYWCQVSNANGSVQSASVFVLVKATGVFAIEAEDFDYNRGQTKPEASVMPYLGGAYADLSAVLGVDYQNDDDPGNNLVDGHPVYRYGGDLGSGPDDPNTSATVANEQPGGQFSITRAGEWEMTANYKVGWVGAGNWGNYTRTFPTPAKTYNVFAASSADNFAAGRLAGSIGEVTAGVGTATQTVKTLASYNAPGTGAWSRNSLVGMREANGSLAAIELGGTKTIRWNYDGGDAEYLLFIPAGGGVAPVINSIVSNPDGSLTITWTGGGTLQASPSISSPSWQDVTGATSPYTFTPTESMLYGRIRQ